MRKNLIRTLPVFIFLFASLLSPGPLAAESRSQDPPYDWHYPETSIPYGTALEDDTEELGEWTDDATFRETGIFEASYTEDLDAFYTYDPEAEMPEHREACFAIHEEAKPAYQLTQLTVYYRTILSEDEGESFAEETGEALPDVPVVVNKKVVQYIKYFQTGGRKHFVVWLERSESYMNMIKRILREEGLPDDLFYIAFIESGLSVKARSRAKAVGMWQFIKGTAKKYGLRVDWWIDERRDPEKATRAAARYFKDLYGHFGSWYLAAAGYNAGEGRVRRAVRNNGSEDFWELAASKKRAFKQETRDYVPKYLAAMLIAKDPEVYGFPSGDYLDDFDYDTVSISHVTDIRVIADAAEVPVEEIKTLNPELLHWFTPPNYPEYELKLPAGTKEVFEANISKIPPPERVRFLEHKVRRGETLSGIARLYGTEVKPLLYMNDIKNLRAIRPGTIIVVPVRASERKGGKGVADSASMRRDSRG